MQNALYLKNARFIDVMGGKFFQQGMGVLVRDGMIMALPGLPGEPTAPAGCREIDLMGKVVIPGLFNTHTHLQLINGLIGRKELRRRQTEKNLEDCLQRGITNIRDAWAPNLALNRALTDRVATGALPGPRVQQCVVVCPEDNWCAPKNSAFTRMFLPLVDYDKPASGAVAVRPGATAREVRDAVDRAVDERGADCIKLYDQDLRFLSYKPGGALLTDEQTAAAVDEARKRGVPVTAHHTRAKHFRRNVACGVTSLAHLPSDEILSERDIEAFLASGCLVEPTLSVSYGMSWGSLCQSGQERSDIEVLDAFRAVTFDKTAEEFWLPELSAIYCKNYRNYSKGDFKFMGVMDMSAPMRLHTAQPHRFQNFRLLHQACSDRIACGNDATVAFYTQAAIRIEIALMKLFLGEVGVEAAPEDLLRVATIQSARAMGIEGRFGSIEKGKVADLAVLDTNPLEDPAAIGSIAAAVFKGGRLVVNNCGISL